MHNQILDLVIYCLFFLAGGCLSYIWCRSSRHLAHEAHKMPFYFFVMMLSGLLTFAVFDLIVFASTSFRLSRLHFAGPFAYTDRLDQPTAVMFCGIASIFALWISLRWLNQYQGKPSSTL